jgi:hypothetical protein
MTPEQRTRLQSLLPAMRANARRAPTMNEYNRRFNEVSELEEFIRRTDVTERQARAWMAFAEKAAEGAEQPEEKPEGVKGVQFPEGATFTFYPADFKGA